MLALVGPPGCGKTTTLVKLAVRHGLACARGVQLITTDTRRVAGVEQLSTYAAILGASFDAVETTRGLEQVLEANREKGLILIDTQGYAAIEMGEAAELAHFLSREERVDVHLVAQVIEQLSEPWVFGEDQMHHQRTDHKLAHGL